MESLKSYMIPCLQRKVSTVKLYQLVPEPMEFPRLNYRAFNGRSYKYFYSLGNDYLHPNKVLFKFNAHPHGTINYRSGPNSMIYVHSDDDREGLQTDSN